MVESVLDTVFRYTYWTGDSLERVCREMKSVDEWEDRYWNTPMLVDLVDALVETLRARHIMLYNEAKSESEDIYVLRHREVMDFLWKTWEHICYNGSAGDGPRIEDEHTVSLPPLQWYATICKIIKPIIGNRISALSHTEDSSIINSVFNQYEPQLPMDIYIIGRLATIFGSEKIPELVELYYSLNHFSWFVREEANVPKEVEHE